MTRPLSHLKKALDLDGHSTGRVPEYIGPVFRMPSTPQRANGLFLDALRCARGERLIGGSHALGFYTPKPPSGALTATVTGAQALRRDGVMVSVSSDDALFGVRAVVQVHALCSRAP